MEDAGDLKKALFDFLALECPPLLPAARQALQKKLSPPLLEQTLRSQLEELTSLPIEEARSILASVAASSPNVTTQYSAVVWPGRREMRVAVALAPGKPATGEHYARVRWDALLRLK